MGKIDAFTGLDEALEPKPVEEYTEEDLLLKEYGIDAKFLQAFNKQHSDKNIFYREKLTNFAFQWYLDAIDQERFDMILSDALPIDLRQRYDKKKEQGIIEVGFSDKKGGTVAEYIEEVERLRKELEKGKKIITTIQAQELLLFDFLGNLYNYLNNEEKVEIKNNTEEDVKMIEKIEEVLGK